MREDDDPLIKVLHLFSPLRHMSSPVVVRDDLLIETDIGCFGITYSASTKMAALFYARDPEAFATTTRVDGVREFIHKERPFFVDMFRIHDPKDKWDHNDTRLQLDLTPISKKIHDMIHELPEAQIRETCLHRTGKRKSASVFVAYRAVPSDETLGEYNVYISTKPTKNHQLFDIPHDDDPEKPGSSKFVAYITRAFRSAGRQMVRHGFASEFELCAIDPVSGEEKTSFTLKELPEAIETNFSKLQEQIREGIDPIRLKDQPIWPMLRAGSYISDKIDEFKETVRHNPRVIASKIGSLLWELKDFGVSAVGKILIEVLGETGSKKHLDQLPDEWRKIIKNRKRRFASIKSDMHELLALTNPDEFRDMSLISPDQHVCNFAHSPIHLTQVSPMSTFNRWLRGLLLSPYDSTFEYRGDKHTLVNPADINQVQTVHMYAANGIVMHYVPKTKQLYAYYHRPDHIMPNHHLHSRAHEFFTADEVLRIDASRHDTFVHRMSFSRFKKEMQAHTGKPDLSLPRADQPEKPMPDAPSAEKSFPSLMMSAALG